MKKKDFDLFFGRTITRWAQKCPFFLSFFFQNQNRGVIVFDGSLWENVRFKPRHTKSDDILLKSL